MSLTRIILAEDTDPFAPTCADIMPWGRGQWPAQWVHHPAQGAGVGGVAWFRRRFSWPGGVLRLHVSADQRFRLRLNGIDLGGGPERGDMAHWRYHSWAGELPVGDYQLSAQVWWLTDAPHAQCSLRPAFICAAEGDAGALLDTGRTPWEVSLDPRWEMLPKRMCWGTGSRTRLRLDAEPDDAWVTPAIHGHALHAGGGACNRGGRWRLIPARLPAQREQLIHVGRVLLVADAGVLDTMALERHALDPAEHLVAEAASWQSLLDGGAGPILSAGARRRVLIDLGEYRCVYPEVTLAGKGRLRIALAEACFIAPEGEQKGNRNEWIGRYFRSTGNEFVIDSVEARSGAALWWESGRFVELLVEAGAALELRDLAWRHTGYPLNEEGRFSCADTALQASFPMMVRTLARCAHETFMDCPYYEQLQYIGDTRLECHVMRSLTRDHRLCIQALDSFAHSLRDEGRLSSRWPTWEWQDIPTFSLMWVGMLHDALMWGNDGAAVRRHLSAMRSILEHFRSRIRPDGLLGWVEGWNFVDWVPGWPAGEIPGEPKVGGGAVNTWLLASAALLAAEIEDWAGEPALAARNRALADSLSKACVRWLWDEEAGCFADTLDRKTWSEHAQLLAILAGVEPARQTRLLAALTRQSQEQPAGTGYDFAPEQIAAALASYASPAHMAKPTVYFNHYRFEVAARSQRAELLFDKLDYWRGLAAQGFSTIPEMPEPSRSDCHAWGSHPRFHAIATILGIRPAAPLFAAVRITPMPGPLEWAEGSWPHPLGDIHVKLRREGNRVHGEVRLPDGLPGILALVGEPERQIKGRTDAW